MNRRDEDDYRDGLRSLAFACGKQGMRKQRASWFDIFIGPPVPIGVPREMHVDLLDTSRAVVDTRTRTLTGLRYKMNVQWARARIAQPFTPEWLKA